MREDLSAVNHDSWMHLQIKCVEHSLCTNYRSLLDRKNTCN